MAGSLVSMPVKKATKKRPRPTKKRPRQKPQQEKAKSETVSDLNNIIDEPQPEESADIPIHIAFIKRQFAGVDEISRKTAYMEWKTGRGLLILRKKTPHGEWEKTVSDNFTFTSRTAGNYMQLAANCTEAEAKSHPICELYVIAGMMPKNRGDAVRLRIFQMLDEPSKIIRKSIELAEKSMKQIAELYMKLPSTFQSSHVAADLVRNALEGADSDAQELGKAAAAIRSTIKDMLDGLPPKKDED